MICMPKCLGIKYTDVYSFLWNTPKKVRWIDWRMNRWMEGQIYDKANIAECNVESRWWVHRCSLYDSFNFPVCLKIFIMKYKCFNKKRTRVWTGRHWLASQHDLLFLQKYKTLAPQACSQMLSISWPVKSWDELMTNWEKLQDMWVTHHCWFSRSSQVTGEWHTWW